MSQPMDTGSAPARRGRVLTAVLVVLSSVAVVVAATAVWVQQVVFDTDRFMATIEPTLRDPGLATLLGTRASDSALEALALEDRTSEALEELDRYLSEALLHALDPGDPARAALERLDRPTLAALAPAIAASLEERVDGAVRGLFGSEELGARLPDLVRRTHQVALSLATDELAELPNVDIEDGEVRLNLIPFIAEALRRVDGPLRDVLPEFRLPDVVSDRVDEGREQLAAAVRNRLPDDFGQVTVMSSDTLAEVQAAVVTMNRLVWLAVLAAVLLPVAAFVLSPDRRRTAVHLGVGVVAAVVVAEVVVRRLERAVVEQVVDPAGAGLTAGLTNQVLSGLRTTEVVLAVAGVLVAGYAYVFGRPAGWVSGHEGPLRVAGISVALLALFVIGLQPLGVLVIAVALAAHLWLVSTGSRRVTQSADELPVS